MLNLFSLLHKLLSRARKSNIDSTIERIALQWKWNFTRLYYYNNNRWSFCISYIVTNSAICCVEKMLVIDNNNIIVIFFRFIMIYILLKKNSIIYIIFFSHFLCDPFRCISIDLVSWWSENILRLSNEGYEYPYFL